MGPNFSVRNQLLSSLWGYIGNVNSDNRRPLAYTRDGLDISPFVSCDSPYVPLVRYFDISELIPALWIRESNYDFHQEKCRELLPSLASDPQAHTPESGKQSDFLPDGVFGLFEIRFEIFQFFLQRRCRCDGI